jgi:dTDP-4-dehydrorhamnose 3,5-epimerase
LTTFEIKPILEIAGAKAIQYNKFQDNRGSIYTTYEKKVELEIGSIFTHDKFVTNNKNCLRGMHGDAHTSKIVTCISGSVVQVLLDVRKNSLTFGKAFSTKINAQDGLSLLVPAGVANGFYSSEPAIYHYKLSYVGEYIDADRQFSYNWRSTSIRKLWGDIEPIVSHRDLSAEVFEI